MYCSSCGSALAQSLSYCNRCGAKVGGAKVDDAGQPPQWSPEPLINAITAVFVVGLGAIIGLMAVMRKVVGFDLNIILAITLLCFLLMLIVESVLIGLLLKVKRGAREASESERQKGQETNELGWTQARALAEPLPSVTEQTTRAFEPLYNERKST
ncbi:MAG TPA: hypothetical protein VGV59_00600 [Pyrinomonadaceae bacterium]|nr:hypothetical protein [Pyrinomonadaceae bacterium]